MTTTTLASLSLNDVANQLLDRTKGRVAQAEVYAYDTTSTPVDFEANRLKSLETKDSRGIALRVVCDGRIGLAATTRLRTASDLDQVVVDAVALAAFGAEARFELPARIDPTAVDVFDPATEAITVESMVGLGQQMIDHVRAYDGDILCEAGVRRAVETTVILNSRGGNGTYKKSSYALVVGGQLIRGQDFLSIWEYDTRCGTDIDAMALARAAVQKFELAKPVATVRTANLPVIFTPRGVASVLLSRFGVSLSGKSVLQGSSALSDKLGATVFDSRLSITDDATLPQVPGSSPFDDEGTPTRPLVLIGNGEVRAFYYDRQTAGLADTETTGHGYRSPESLPGPSTSVVRIAPGQTPVADLIGGVDEGLLIESMTGTFAGNVFSGDFSGNVHIGFKIEGGKIVGRVKDTMVAGNIFADMKELGGLSDVAEWVGGRVQSPHILFQSLGVSSKS
jgi:PmbA protein